MKQVSLLSLWYCLPLEYVETHKHFTSQRPGSHRSDRVFFEDVFIDAVGEQMPLFEVKLVSKSKNKLHHCDQLCLFAIKA